MFLANYDFEGTNLVYYEAPDKRPVVTASSLLYVLKGNMSNSARIVKNNVNARWWREIKNPKGGRNIIALYEPGAYQLTANKMFDSELTERLQTYIFETVMPQINAKGGYISPTATSNQLEGLTNRINELQGKIDVFQSFIGTMPIPMYIDMLRRNHQIDLYLYEEERNELANQLKRNGITLGEYDYATDSMKVHDLDFSRPGHMYYPDRGLWLPSLIHWVISHGTKRHEIKRLRTLEKCFTINYDLLNFSSVKDDGSDWTRALLGSL